MKIKPISNDSNIKETIYNKNILKKYTTIKSGSFNPEKRDYSSIALLSLMFDSGFVKPEKFDTSFDDANKFINEYEGKN